MKTFIHTHTHTRQLRSSSGQVVQCPTHVQHVRPQKLCRSRDSCVEQSAIESTWRKTQFSELQAPAENSLVYCWPLRNVNNYLLRYRNTRTYWLTQKQGKQNNNNKIDCHQNGEVQITERTVSGRMQLSKSYHHRLWKWRWSGSGTSWKALWCVLCLATCRRRRRPLSTN